MGLTGEISIELTWEFLQTEFFACFLYKNFLKRQCKKRFQRASFVNNFLVSSLSVICTRTRAYHHTTLSAREPVGSRKLSNVGRG